MVNIIEAAFPALRTGHYRITSPPTNHYNCIAWAGGDVFRWWWPISAARFYWPPGVPREETVAAFEAAFFTIGYVPCADEEREPGFDKVALFAAANGIPTHAARQLENARWTSKLGEMEDVEHALRDLEGDIYGTIVRFLKRPTTTDLTQTVGAATGSEP